MVFIFQISASACMSVGGQYAFPGVSSIFYFVCCCFLNNSKAKVLQFTFTNNLFNNSSVKFIAAGQHFSKSPERQAIQECVRRGDL